MGKINQFNRRQFASTFVGGPTADRSGEIAVAGIQAAVQPAIDQQARVLRERELISIDQQASDAVMKYGLEFQKKIVALRTEFADNPNEYAEAEINMGQELAAAMGEGIADKRVRARATKAFGVIIKQSSPSAINWGVDKQTENGLIASRGIMRTAALTTGRTSTFGALKFNLDETLAEIKRIPNLSKSEKEEFVRKNMPEMLESHFGNRIDSDPQALIDDFKSKKSGGYDDIEFFDSKMKQKFLSAARTRIRQNETRIKTAQMDNYADDLDAMADGTLTFDDIGVRLTEENEANRIRKRDAVRLKEALINRIEGSAGRLLSSNDSSEKYIRAVYEVLDNRTDRAKALDKIVDVFRDGEFTSEETKYLNEMRRDFLAPKKQERRDKVMGFIKELGGFLSGIFAEAIPQAKAVRSFMLKAMSGDDLQESVIQVTKDAERENATATYPNLASQEDPVEHAYRMRAIEILEQNSYPTDDSNVRMLIEQLKETDNRSAQ